MVDLGNKGSSKDKGDKSSSSGSKKKKKKSKSKSSSSNSDESTEPFEMGEESIPDASEATVGDTSKRWASEGAELNVDAGAGGTVEEYIQRQIKECDEFYEDFVDNSKRHMVDVDQFTLYFHALTLAMARNRMGIRDLLMDRFGKSKAEAISITDEIVDRAGEKEAFDEIIRALMSRLDDE